MKFSDFNEQKYASIEENRVWNWLKEKFEQLRNLIFNLRFGQSKTLSLDLTSLREEYYLTEAGDWHATVMGVYAEKWAVWSLINEMEKSNLKVGSSSKDSKKEAEEYGRILKRSVKDGVSYLSKDQKKLSQTSIDTVTDEMPGYKEKGIALGKRIMLEQLSQVADSAYCKYEVLHSGGSDSRISTADLKVEKYNEKDMKEEYRYSLKAYLSSGEVTKGTQKDPFGVLGMAIGIDNMTVRTFHRYQDQFEKAFGKEVSAYAEQSREITAWVRNRTSEIKKKGIVSPYGLNPSDQSKLEAAQKFGHEIIDLQIDYWIKLFEVAGKKKPNELKRAVMQLLDLGDNYATLITAGMDKKGQIVTWKNASPDLQKLMSTPLEKIDISIDAPEKPLTKRKLEYGLDKAIGKKTKKSSNMNIVFSVEGIELYRVGSQTKISGGAQFNTKCGNKIKSVHLDNDISEMLGATNPKLKKLVEQELKTPGSTRVKAKPKRTTRSAVKNGDARIKPNLMQVRAAGRKLNTYVTRRGIDIDHLSKSKRAELTDLVARGLSPEEALSYFEID